MNGRTELNAGVLGETALPRFSGLNPVVAGITNLRNAPTPVGVEPQRTRRGGIFNFGFFIFSRIRGTRSRADYLLTPSPDAGRGRAAKGAKVGRGIQGWVRGGVIVNTGVLLKGINTARVEE